MPQNFSHSTLYISVCTMELSSHDRPVNFQFTCKLCSNKSRIQSFWDFIQFCLIFTVAAVDVLTVSLTYVKIRERQTGRFGDVATSAVPSSVLLGKTASSLILISLLTSLWKLFTSGLTNIHRKLLFMKLGLVQKLLLTSTTSAEKSAQLSLKNNQNLSGGRGELSKLTRANLANVNTIVENA